MPISINDIIRVAARQKLDSVTDVVGVFHFRVVANPIPATDANLLADVADQIANAYSQCASILTNRLSPVDITVYNITDDAPAGQTSWGTAYTGGGSSGEMLPPATAVLVLYNTAVKRTIGKTYLGPCAEGNQNGGLWSGATLTAAANFTAELRQNAPQANGTELEFGIYKRSTGQLLVPTSIRVQPVVAYQRRRKPGVGS